MAGNVGGKEANVLFTVAMEVKLNFHLLHFNQLC